ncbi:MAG: hypothetical protein ACI9VS_001785, partial [Candidatus Binatia bacterium]
ERTIGEGIGNFPFREGIFQPVDGGGIKGGKSG